MFPQFRKEDCCGTKFVSCCPADFLFGPRCPPLLLIPSRRLRQFIKVLINVGLNASSSFTLIPHPPPLAINCQLPLILVFDFNHALTFSPPFSPYSPKIIPQYLLIFMDKVTCWMTQHFTSL